MNRRFHRQKIGIRVSIGVVGVILLLLILTAVKRWMDVAAVQNALQRDWEITFGAETLPAAMPLFVDSAADSIVERFWGDTHGYDGSQPPRTRNRDVVYRARVRALFCGPMREIHIYYPEAFSGDLGDALARFPSLRRLTVVETEPNLPTESDWSLLCTRLRSFPNLEEIELGGSWITDAAIAPLFGHPKLRSISIIQGRLTSECAKTFSSIPQLSKLHIEEQLFDGDAWLSEEEKAAMKAALPSVSVELPKEREQQEPEVGS